MRGLDAIDLARKAHLSPTTVSAALAGKPISASSLRLMAGALQATPVDEFIDRLLVPVAKTEP
jgi:transcriptional regulator with XRE-family HTH domain